MMKNTIIYVIAVIAATGGLLFGDVYKRQVLYRGLYLFSKKISVWIIPWWN